ncbi:MAG: hypothetical protein ACJ788_14110 [Ktedonobacteraceae bacterium]
MPSPRKFVNPLTQPSERTTETSTETETYASTLPSTETSTQPSTYTSTSPQVQHRKRGSQAFEKTHERITLWVDKGLKLQFEALADEQGISKTQLLNEAIGDLLKKHEA